jgi:hypothetical protein
MAKRQAARARRGTTDRLREYALVGARARLEELRAEEAQLRTDFPELFRGGRRPAATSSDGGGARATRRRRRNLSPEQRQATSERMRKYWAEWRKKRGARDDQ